MSRLALVEQTKLNLSEVVVVLAGGSPLEVDVLMQVFAGFGAKKLKRVVDPQQLSDAVRGGDIDLLVVDAMLGLSVALDIVREMRRSPGATRFTPVVLTTANASPSMIADARHSGVNYVVAKPLAPRILFERLVWIVRDSRKFIDADNYAGPDRRVRAFGPPAGTDGRREGDLSSEVGDASTPNLSQADIDAMMFPVRKSV